MSEVVENYIETIYNLLMEGEPVIGARLAQKFGVAPATVTATLHRLERDGYITMDGKKHVHLTEDGERLAESVLRRHRLSERFLVDLLGLSWHEVHEEACRMEHVMSGIIEERVTVVLGNPKTCPHGGPIPGNVPRARDYLRDHQALRLSEAEPGQEFTILSISEVVEDEHALLQYLYEKGLKPGTRLVVAERVPQSSVVILNVDERTVVVTQPVAAKIWVVDGSGSGAAKPAGETAAVTSAA